MKKILSLALCFAAMSLVGCAGSGVKSVDPSWVEAPSSLTVFMTEPTVQNRDDVADDLPDYADNFSGWVFAQMGSEFEKQSGLTPKFEVKGFDAFDMVRTQVGKKKEINAPVPKFDEVGVSEGYIISFAPVDVARISETRMTGPTSVETTTYLQFIADYTISNAAEKKVVASGSLKVRRSFGFAMTKSDWEKNMASLVEEVVAKTPLQKK